MKSLLTYFNKGKRTFTNEEDFHFFTQSFHCNKITTEARKETSLKVINISIVKVNGWYTYSEKLLLLAADHSWFGDEFFYFEHRYGISIRSSSHSTSHLIRLIRIIFVIDKRNEFCYMCNQHISHNALPKTEIFTTLRIKFYRVVPNTFIGVCFDIIN
jgi:hypothetical protein